MGNCSFKGAITNFEGVNSIRVLKDSGEIVEFKGPKLAKDVLNEYPGYGIFRQGHASSPLSDHERLIMGQFYYLLPLEKVQMFRDSQVTEQARSLKTPEKLQVECSMNQTDPPKLSSADFVDNLSDGQAIEVLPSQKNGVWKVKLVINTKQLEEILSEEVNTEALIEKMRMVAAASSASVTPRRTKSSWIVGWMPPAFSNVFKLPIINC